MSRWVGDTMGVIPCVLLLCTPGCGSTSSPHVVVGVQVMSWGLMATAVKLLQDQRYLSAEGPTAADLARLMIQECGQLQTSS